MDNNVENKFSKDPGNDPKIDWDAIRKRQHDDSFPIAADWIRATGKAIRVAWTRKRKRRRKLAWVSIGLLFILFIVSCTYRVERVEKSGTLVHLGIDKQEKQSFKRLSSLQQLYTFTSYAFLQPGNPAVTSFVFFIPAKESEKLVLITRELKLLSGLRNLDVSPVNYKIKESLFSTFLHKTLRVGNQQKLKKKDLAQHIQATLNKKGLGFLLINVLNDKDEKVSFTVADQSLGKNNSLFGSDTSTLESGTPSSEGARLRTGLQSRKHKENEKLQIFDWLLGTWQVKYVPNETYHHWVRMNDSSLICFIITYEDNRPNVSIGFSIKYSAADSAILSLRGIEWRFISANDKEIRFKNETTPKSANVKWSLDNEKKTWQSVISGERNLEIVNLVRDEGTDLESIVKDFITKNPDKVKL